SQIPAADPHRIVVFSDAAISGATMERPGMARLLAAAKSKRVDLVVAEGLDRLSRSLKDIAAIYETLGYHGASIWTAHEGQVTELHIGLKGTMNALFLRDMKAKVRRGQSARVAAGYAASSCAYGYQVVRGVTDSQGRYINGVREIDHQAAAVIRRVYREFADGRTIPEIIAGLNRDGIPAPAGGLWKRNALMGGAKKQEGILRNEIYLGRLVFNRSYVVRDPVTNRKRQIPNREAEWTRVDVPHLRIVDNELWSAVRALDQPHPRTIDPPKEPEPRILNAHNQHALTGWVKCGWCGGPKSLANQTRYLCSVHRYAKKCKNSRGTKEPVLMAATFEALQARIEEGPDFRPALVQAVARETRRIAELQKREGELKGRIARLLISIERGVNTEAVTERILTLQDEQAQLRRDVLAERPAELPAEAAIRATFARAVREIELADEVKRTRLMFQCLLQEIVLTPIAELWAGETIQITLREEGWPDFWRMVCNG
ncbi:MAG: recombinase family protein, partial [Magnetospirillum sp.]